MFGGNGRGGRRGARRSTGGRQLSLNTRFDNLVRSQLRRPLRLLNPDRTKDAVVGVRAAERNALYDRFGLQPNARTVHSTIDLPHLPSGLHALDNVPQPKARRTPKSRTADPQAEPEQWLVDIMFPELARRSPSLTSAPSLAPSPVVSHCEENIPPARGPHPAAQWGRPVPLQPQPVTHTRSAPPPLAPLPLHPLSVQPLALPPTLPNPSRIPQIPGQGPAGWATPWVAPTTRTLSAPGPFIPLWLTPHGVVDATGRPLHLASPIFPPHDFQQHNRRPRTSSHSTRRKRRRWRSPSYSSESELYDRDRVYEEYEYERPGRRPHGRAWPIPTDDTSGEDGAQVGTVGKHWSKPLNTGDITKDLADNAHDHFEEDGTGRETFDEERDPEPVPNPTPFVRSRPSTWEQDLSVPAHGTSSTSQHPAPVAKSRDDGPLSLCQPSQQLKDQPLHQSNRTPFPTFPAAPTPISTRQPRGARRGPRGDRVIETLERAATTMPEDEDVMMRGEPSPNLEPAIYPPTPATTVPSTISRPHPSAQVSSEVYAKSPARLQRASERAWAALAAMQPRYEHQDPVAAATPAPPSPALRPVDAEVSDEGEQFADVEDDEEIYQFSDDGRFDLFDAALDPDVPQFDLSWEEVEADEEDIEMGQSESLPPRMNVKSSVASGLTTPKRVRFAWDIGGVGESDPGFKVWRDGY